MNYPIFGFHFNNTMKKHIILLFLMLINLAGNAQNANWGTGSPITTNVNSSDIDIFVFEPLLSGNVVANLNVGSNPIFRNSDGVIVAYGSNNSMMFATYDWGLHTWKQGSIYIGSTNAKILTADGIVVGYGSNNDMVYGIYDVNLHSWQTGSQYIGSSNDTITVADGIVAGYGSNNDLVYATYDVQLQSWKTNSVYIGASNAKIANSDGVIIGYGSNNDLVYATYDIELQTWKTGSVYIGSTNAEISTVDGIVAGYGSNNDLVCAVYDFNLSTWKTNSIYVGNTGSFTLSSGLITYSGSSSSGTTGYNAGSTSWQSAPTTAQCKLLPYGVANSSWVRMRCMSFGAGSFSYSCGDGHQIYRKEGWKKYTLSNSYNVELNVTNGTNNSSCDAIIDITPGIEENHLSLFTIFPNPASNVIHLKFPNPLSGDLKLLNYLGETVLYRAIINEESADLSISESGIYLVQFTSNGKVFSKRVEVIN